MKLKTLKKLIFDKHIFGFLSLTKSMNSIYSTSFATSAHSCGLLVFLNEQPRTLEEIRDKLGIDRTGQEGLKTWLMCGIKFGELKLQSERYQIRGKLSKTLANPKNESAGATLEEVVRYHYDAILHAPTRLRSGQKYTLADQDGALIAKSSRILEPFVEEAIEWAIDGTQTKTVLEVGCGTGYYLRYMKGLYPFLKIHAIDYQQDVVDLAKLNLRAWGMEREVEVECYDIFNYPETQRFDLITLHNNIYYFPDAMRAHLFAKLHQLLAPGGRLLLTTSCKGGSPAIASLELWWVLSDINGTLPEIAEMQQMIKAAGFSQVDAKRLLPGESYFGVVARK